MFDKPDVFYTNDPKIIFNDEWLLDHNKIQNLNQHKLAVLDFSSEHYGVDGLDHVYAALENASVNFLLLVQDPNDHKKFPKMLFYPYWYQWARRNFIVKENNSEVRTYKWSCLNGNPRAHRIYNYYYSQQQSYYDSAHFTFYNAEITRPDDVILPSEVIDFWKNIRHTMPSRAKIQVGLNAGARCDLPANADSYIHLVTETTVVPKIFVSEKTWKPIASGQIFLIFGNPGTVSYLRNQGVDVFDDIIDHSYDSNLDWQSRLHQIHQQLQKLIVQDLPNLYINTQQRRRTNIEKFFSGAFDDPHCQDIEQCINMLS